MRKRGSGSLVTWWGGVGDQGVERPLTFSTNADFKHAGAKTVSSWHAEALVAGVVFGTHENVTGGCEAIRLDAFHLHVLHIGKMDGSGERK